MAAKMATKMAMKKAAVKQAPAAMKKADSKQQKADVKKTKKQDPKNSEKPPKTTTNNTEKKAKSSKVPSAKDVLASLRASIKEAQQQNKALSKDTTDVLLKTCDLVVSWGPGSPKTDSPTASACVALVRSFLAEQAKWYASAGVEAAARGDELENASAAANDACKQQEEQLRFLTEEVSRGATFLQEQRKSEKAFTQQLEKATKEAKASERQSCDQHALKVALQNAESAFTHMRGSTSADLKKAAKAWKKELSKIEKAAQQAQCDPNMLETVVRVLGNGPEYTEFAATVLDTFCSWLEGVHRVASEHAMASQQEYEQAQAVLEQYQNSQTTAAATVAAASVALRQQEAALGNLKRDAKARAQEAAKCERAAVSQRDVLRALAVSGEALTGAAHNFERFVGLGGQGQVVAWDNHAMEEE